MNKMRPLQLVHLEKSAHEKAPVGAEGRIDWWARIVSMPQDQDSDPLTHRQIVAILILTAFAALVIAGLTLLFPHAGTDGLG
jgi:hypothetical protein